MAEATQTKTTIAIDPVTRIEGHLKAEVVVENGKVVDAKLTGGMYRGFDPSCAGVIRATPPRSCSASAACALWPTQRRHPLRLRPCAASRCPKTGASPGT